MQTTRKHNKIRKHKIVMWTRARTNSVSRIQTFQCTANGTCHMLIFSLAHSPLTSPSSVRTVYFIDLLNSMRRLFIISNGEKGKRAHNRPVNKLRTLCLFARWQIAIDSNTVAAGCVDWRSCERASMRKSTTFASTDLALARVVALNVWPPLAPNRTDAIRETKITSFSTWRRYENSLPFAVRTLFVILLFVDLSTPHFRSDFYLRKDVNCPTSANQNSRSFYFIFFVCFFFRLGSLLAHR